VGEPLQLLLTAALAIGSGVMILKARETTSKGLVATTGVVAMLMSLLGCPVQSASAVETTREKTQAVQASSQRLAATRQQLVLLDDRIAKLPAEDAARLTSFVVGNLLFVLVHELGHAVISQLNLPVLGREEDAADSFATLSMLFVGTELSHTVLRETARGLMMTADRDKSSEQLPAMYDEHSLDTQRAFQIVCLMVGSDPKKFRDVAAIGRMPPERQETCSDDFGQAADSWETLLSGRRNPAAKSRFLAGQSSARKGSADIKVRYIGQETGPAFQSVLKTAGVLETVARFGREILSLPRPMTIKAMKCGEPNAYWDGKDREIVLCFELVGEFIELGLRPPPANGSRAQ
jgi:hypothetical protein